MAIAEIIKKIEADAQSRAQDILTQAQTQAQAITSQAEAEAGTMHDQLVRQGEIQAAQLKQQERQIAQLEARKRLLSERLRLIGQALDLALKQLVDLPVEEYRRLLKTLLEALPLKGDEDIIACAGDEVRIDQGFMDSVNRERSLRGLKAELTLAQQRRACKGGLIIRQGQVEFNYSFDGMIRARQDELEAQIAGILFPAGV